MRAATNQGTHTWRRDFCTSRPAGSGLAKTPSFVALFSRFGGVRTTESSEVMERAMGIEPTSEAWEALNKTLKAIDLAALSVWERGLQLETKWKLKAVTDS